MRILSISLFLLLSLSISAQSIDQVAAAVKSANVEMISSYFDEDLEVCIHEVEDIFDKTIAKNTLSSFYASHKPVSFKKIHEGSSKSKDSSYFIGRLNTSDGDFRVYVYCVNYSGNYKIQEFRIDQSR